jgi:hypothetical protein
MLARFAFELLGATTVYMTLPPAVDPLALDVAPPAVELAVLPLPLPMGVIVQPPASEPRR